MSMPNLSAMFGGMKSPEKPVALPLEYAAELVFELHLLRGECGDVARGILEQEQPDEGALEECALLDEAIAKAHGILGSTLQGIRAQRDQRSGADN